MADGIIHASGAEATETLHDRVYDIASRFLRGISVVNVVIQHLQDNNTQGMNAELAETLALARNHMNAAHNDLDVLSGELSREAQS